jgi:hypothetical protein
MTNDEVQAYVGKAVRLTMSDGSVVAGTLHVEGAHGHAHLHYRVVSDPIRQGGEKASVLIHGADLIAQIADASDDPAAVE